MKRIEAETVGEIINRLLKAENLEEKFDEQRVVALWPEIVGQGINRYTVNRYVRDGVLCVTISSAPLRNELMLNRSRLVDRINDFIGKRVIREVVFR
ncbi:MAG: DUF721 domain-containing protein [Muribaculaceae bacterium]